MLMSKNVFKLLSLSLLVFHMKTFCSFFETSSQLVKKLYYEADEIQYLPKSKQILLKDNVIFLYDEIFFSANKVNIFHDKQLVVADGKVSILHKKERISAEKLIFNLKSKKMRLDNVEISIDNTDASDISGLNENEIRLYNISKAEIVYEKERTKRAQEIKNELLFLQEKYSWLIENQIERKEDTQNIIKRYSMLLERFLRTSKQNNTALLKLPKSIRQKILKRRQTIKNFQKKNQKSQMTFFNSKNIKDYLSIFAERVYRDSDSTYKIEKASISSCKCQEENGFRIWNLKANSSQITLNEYIDIHGSAFQIFELPIFYFPILKVSIHQGRRSGFLFPSLYIANNQQVVSVPYFQTLGNSFDLTLTTNYFSRKGLRFDLDFQGQITKESFVKSKTEFIQDQEMNKARWINTSAFNLTLPNRFAIKAHSQILSDALYLEDFSRASSQYQYLFLPDPRLKRFLNKEFSFEYYGNTVGLSIRTQALRDLFAANKNTTPARLPLVEFYLLPQRLFSPYLVFSNYSSYENVSRMNWSGATIPSNRSKFYSNQKNDAISEDLKNIEKIDMRYEGQRVFTQSEFLIPFPANKYVNLNLKSKPTFIYYDFKSRGIGVDPKKADEYYLKNEVNFEIPFHAISKFESDFDATRHVFQKNFIPFLRYEYTPNVHRSKNFPESKNAFYESDIAVSNQTFYFGLKSNIEYLKFKYLPKEGYENHKKNSTQVADLKLLEKALLSYKVKTTQELLKLSKKDKKYKEIFLTWAYEELNYNTFKNAKNSQDKKNSIAKEEFSMSPLSYELGFSYNIKKDDGFNPDLDYEYKNSKLGDINAKFSWSLHPILTMNGDGEFTYSPSQKELKGQKYSLKIDITKYFEIYSIYEYKKLIDDSTFQSHANRTLYSDDYKRVRTTDLKFTLRPFLNLQSTLKDTNLSYHWRKEIINYTQKNNSNDSNKYASALVIEFKAIQKCIDIFLSRTKDYDMSEKEAIYGIGINMKFLGKEYKQPKVSDFLDSFIKKHFVK